MPPEKSGKLDKPFPVARKRITKNSKRKKKRSKVTIYANYIYKILRQVHPDLSISSRTMNIMNNFANDIFERIASEASKLCRYSGHATLTSREIQTATRFLLPGELSKHAVSEGTKAITKYNHGK